MSSVPPPTSAPPPPPSLSPQLELRIEAGHDARNRLLLETSGVTIEHGRVLRAPLELPLGAVKVAAVDPGPAKASGPFGRFAILRRLGPTSVLPRSEGIEGWLWTSTGGTGLTNLGEEQEAPNVALVFTKPLDGGRLHATFDPDYVTALAARSPLGTPAVLGVLFRVTDALAAESGFRRWGFQSALTDREIPPTLRRHLPHDRPANPTVRGADDTRAATSVAPPGMA